MKICRCKEEVKKLQKNATKHEANFQVDEHRVQRLERIMFLRKRVFGRGSVSTHNTTKVYACSSGSCAGPSSIIIPLYTR